MKRPPIVVIMGHVDHGKTTLLDYIRKTTLASKEAGGITQAIGAYEIERPSASSGQMEKITFIDTPGHEAFHKMRVHGARIADVAILVVAADESVKPQTKDALQNILEAKIPYLVAINKIDKPGANIEKTKQDLSQNSVFLEGFGGNISWQAISAKTGQGVKELLDLILLTADLEELTYDPKAPASGIVITSHLDPRRGNVVGLVLSNGTLRKNSEIFTPQAKGKIKTLENFKGELVDSLEPSSPALVLGFEEMPAVGDVFSTDVNAIQAFSKKVTQNEAAAENALPIILKANEMGSLAALEHVIEQINKQTPLQIIDKSVGDVYENDIKLAQSAKAFIAGFKIKVDRGALNMAKSQNIQIITSPVIYDLEKQVQKYVNANALKPKRILEVLAVFGKRKDKKQIVGGRVITGTIKNQEVFEIEENGIVIGKGKITNLQSGKQDVKDVAVDKEAGLLTESDVEIKKGAKLLF